jgi:hypothetical protein
VDGLCNSGASLAITVDVAPSQQFFLGVKFSSTASQLAQPSPAQRRGAISAISTVAATTAGSYLYPKEEKL